MISSIQLMNWRSHRDSLLQFKKGTNLLIGMMGSGKSSILDAISFALFGTFPALDRRRLKLADVLRTNETLAQVELKLSWNGIEYKIIRKINRKKESANSEAQIYENGKLIDDGSEAVTKYIENLLGVNYDLFTRAIYSEQNNIDYFLSIDPKRRKEEVDRLLGLDKFEEARANLTSVINRVKENRKNMEQQFNRDYLAELLCKKTELENKIVAIKTSLEELNNKIEKTTKQLEAKEKTFKELLKKKEYYEKLLQEKIKLQTITEKLEKELEGKEIDREKEDGLKKERELILLKMKELLESQNKVNSLLSTLSSQRGSLETKKKILLSKKEEIEKNEKHVSDLLKGKELEQMKKELVELEKGVLALLSERKMLEKNILDEQELIKAIMTEISECPLCSTKLSKEQVDILRKDKEQNILNMKKDVEELKKKSVEEETKINNLRNTVREIELSNVRLLSLKKEYLDPTTLDKELNTIFEEITKMQCYREEVQSNLDHLNKQNEHLSLKLQEYEQFAKKKDEQKVTMDKLLLLSKSLDELSFDDKTLEKERFEFEALRVQYERDLSEKRANEEQTHSILEIQTVLDRDLLRLHWLDNEIKIALKTEDELIIYKNALQEAQFALRSEMVDSINTAMNEVWEIFYPHKNYETIRLEVTEKDYELQIYQQQWKTLESIASGGERACAALTLRVALAMVLTPNLSWLILDEPTHNLDKDAIELLSNTLQYKVPEVVQQTFVITHDEALAGSEFASSYKLSRNKEMNGQTTVEVL